MCNIQSLKRYYLFLIFFLFVFSSFSQAAAFTLSGTVYGGSNPLPDATVSLKNADTGTQLGSSVTDVNGLYSFTVDNGTYNLGVVAPANSGFSDSVVNGVVINGGDVTQNVVLLSQGFTLSGVVRDPNGSPINGVNLAIYDQATDARVGSFITTDVTGAYSFLLSNGVYRIRMYGYASQSNTPIPDYWTNEAVVTDITLSADTNLDIFPFVTLSGKTTDSNGTPVGNVELLMNESWYTDSGGPSQTYRHVEYLQGLAKSDANGNFSINLIPHDNYSLTWAPPTGSNLGNTVFNNVSVISNTNRDFILKPPFTLSGVVRDPGGNPINGVSLSVHDQSSKAQVGNTVTTNSTGNYSFSIASGTYRIKMYGSAVSSNTPMPDSWLKDPVVSEIAITSDKTLDIFPFVRLSGKITDPNGNAVGGAGFVVDEYWYTYPASGYVTHSLDYSKGLIKSDASGNYSLNLLPKDNHSIALIAPAGSGLGDTLYQNVAVTSSSTRDFVLSNAFSLTGVVRLPDETPMNGVSVIVRDQTSGAKVSEVQKTESTGEFSFALAPGEYKLKMYGYSGQANATIPRFWISGSVVSNITLSQDESLDVYPFVSISGKTTDSNGVAVSGVEFFILDYWHTGSDAHQIEYSNGSLTSDSNGNYTINVLPYNNYSETIIPPSGSGFAQTLINNLDISQDIQQNVILNFVDTEAPLIIAGPYVNHITDTRAVVEWQTNEPASSDVSFGLSDPPGSSASVAGFRTDHSVVLENLTPDSLYYLTVSSTDEPGNGPVNSQVVTFQTKSVPDAGDPFIISGPIVTSITHNSAVIQWETDEPADSYVFYGLSQALESNATSASFEVNHSMNLTGLSLDTTYYFKVASTDAVGNGPVESSIHSFTTLAQPDVDPPLIISGPMVEDITDTAATIIWETNEPATSGVSCNDGTAYIVASDDALVSRHAVRINNLTSGTLYTCTISSKDGLGNGPVLSDPFDFPTLSAPDTSAPVILEGPMVLGITHQSAVIRWVTGERADSVVQFGLTPDVLDNAKSNTSLTLNHNLPLVGLQTDTEYFFRVFSKDSSGNGPVASAIYSFRTRAVPDTAQPELIHPLGLLQKADTTATLYWETDEPSDSVVDFGAGTSTNLRWSNAEKVAKHQVTIAGLTPGQDYTFDVSSTDTSGNRMDSSNTNSSGQVNMDSQPDVTAPVVTEGPVVLSVGDTTAVIRWVTDEASDSRVVLIKNGESLNQITGSMKPVKEHLVTLTELTPDSGYSFRVSSRDVPRNMSNQSADVNFTTASTGDATPPVIVQQANAVMVSDTTAMVSWGTDEYSGSQVDFGLAANDLRFRAGATGITADHKVALTGLTSGATYYYQVTSQDIAGNLVQSAVQSFNASVDSSAPVTGVSPAGGTFYAVQTVRLSCTDNSDGSGCDKTYYTEDGSEPTTSSTVYTTAISISSTTTLKFFSVDLAGNSEPVKTESYTIITDSTPPSTSVSTPGGKYSSIQNVSLSCTDNSGGSGCDKTYYTEDGSEPTTSSTVYATAISISSTTTLKFFSVDLAGNSESVQTEAYNVRIKGGGSGGGGSGGGGSGGGGGGKGGGGKKK